MKKYYLDFQQYATNQNLYSNCNAITFINIGASSVFINKLELATGASLSIQGNENEIDTTTYEMYFSTGNGNLSVIRKFYK